MTDIILLTIFSVLFFWLSWKRTDLALTAIVVLLPSYLVRFRLFSIPATLLELMIILVFVAWVIRKVITGKPKKISMSKFWLPAVLFLFSAVIAIFVSPDLEAALGIFKAYFLETLLFYFIFINTVRSAGQIKLILWALGLSALFVSLIALWQYLDLLPSHEPWISESPARVTSVFEYPNAVGLYLAPIAALFLGLFLLVRQDDSKKGLLEKNSRFILGVVIFSLLAIVLSFSRGAILGIIASVIFFGFFSRYKKWIWLILVLCILITLAIPQFRSVIINVATFNDVSTDVRMVMWEGTWNLLKDRPLLGAGLAGFPTVYDQYRLIKHTELLLYPHNIVFNFWVELGLAGLVIFLWIIIKFFKKGISLRSKYLLLDYNYSSNLALALMGAMIAMLIYGMVDVPYFKNDLSVLFWLIVGLMVISERVDKNA